MVENGNSSNDGRPDAEFKLSITRALADQLKAALKFRTPVPLNADAIAQLRQREPGIYQLYQYHDGVETLVYVGKASKSLETRLKNHLRKLRGRGLTDIRFTCLYVEEDLEATAPEKMLIKRHKVDGQLEWNTNGFGNKDPGKQRDATAVKENHFDASYPIDLDYEMALTQKAAEAGTVLAALKDLKKNLPYLLRFAEGTPDALGKARLEIDDPTAPRPLAEWLPLIVAALPSGWQATALPGYVVLYEVAAPSDYPSATRYWRNENGHVQDVQVAAVWAAPGRIVDDPESDDE